MIILADVYENLDAGEYTGLLHEDFRSLILLGTRQVWEDGGNPLVDNVFYRDTEIRIHENLFSGNTGIYPDGNDVPPVESIEIGYMTRGEAWIQVAEDDHLFGGLGGYWAPYHFLIYFNLADETSLKVQQTVDAFVCPVVENGKEIWKLLGLEPKVPSTPGIKAGGGYLEVSLDFLKTLYR